MPPLSHLLAGVLLTAALRTAAQAPSANSFALRHVRVFDGETVASDQTVVVRGGRIAAVGPAAAIPGDVPVLDASGQTLLPGLIDAHVHVFAWGTPRQDALRLGVTTELDMFSDWRGIAAARRQRESLAPTNQADFWSAGTLATVAGGHGTEYRMRIPVVASPAGAPAFVAARVREGSDYIKLIMEDGSVYGLPRIPTLSADEVRALVAAAHAAHKLAVVHVAKEEDARIAVEAGADGLAHIFQDRVADPGFIAQARARGTFVIATLSVIAGFAHEGDAGALLADSRIKPYLDPEQSRSLHADFPMVLPQLKRNAMASVRLLHEAGVPLLAGTDAPNPRTAHGASLHEELLLLTESGLSPVEALRAATSLPARYFHLDDRGRIAPGLRADLLLVQGDPTIEITATRDIARIWKNGYPVDRSLPAGN